MKRAVARCVALIALASCTPPAVGGPEKGAAVSATPSKPCSNERDVTGEMLGTQHFRPRSVERLAISVDGAVVMTAGGATVELWDGHSGERRRTFPTWLGRVALSADGKRLATRKFGLLATTLQVLRVEGGDVVWSWPGDPPEPTALALDRTGETLAIGLESGHVDLVRVAKDEPARRLAGQQGEIHALAFSPTAARLVVAGAKGRLELWDVESERVETLPVGETSVMAATFSAHGARLVAGDADGGVRIFDAEGRPLETFRALIPDEPREIRGVAVTDDGTRVLVGTWSGVVALFEPPRETPIAVLAEGGLLATGVAFTPDAGTAVAGVLEGALRFWDARTGVERASEHRGNLAAPDAITWSADGHRAIVAGGANAPHVWDMRCGELTGGLEAHGRRVKQLASTRDGAWLATGGNDGWLRLWDGRDLRRLHEARDHVGDVTAVAVSEDGWIVASGGRRGAIVARDTARFDVMLERPADDGLETVLALAVSEKRGLLLAGDVMGAVAWLDLATSAPLAIVEDDYPSNVRAIVFSPDGRLVATAASDNVRIYDAATAKNTVTFSVSAWSVSNPAWLADGRRLAFGDSDGHLWVVDAAEGRVLRTARIEEGDIAAVAAHPRNETLITGHGDTTMKLWDLGLLAAPVAAEGAIAEGAIEVSATPASELATAHPLPVSARKQCPGGGEELHPACARSRRGKGAFHLEDTLQEMGVVRFSPDAKLLAVGGGERLEILELPSGRVRNQLPCCIAAPVAAEFSPDGRWLVVSAWAQGTQLWDLQSGRMHERWSESAAVLAVSSDGSTWAGATRKGELFVTDRRGRDVTKLPRPGEEPAPVQSLALSPTGARLLVHRPDVDVELWDVRARTLRWSLSGEDALPPDLADSVVSKAMFGPSESVLVVAGDHLFELARGVWTSRAIPLTEGGPVECALEGKLCVEAIEEGLGIAIPGQAPQELKAGDVDRFAVSADGAWAAVAVGEDLALWDLSRARRMNPPTLAPPGGISVTRAGKLLTLHDGEARWWPLREPSPSPALPFEIEAARTTRDGAFVVARDDSELFAVPAAGGNKRSLAKGRFAGWPEVTEDGRWVAAVRREDDRAELVVMELATGKAVWRHPLAEGAGPKIALSRAGDLVALGDDDALEIWTIGGSQRARVDVEHDVHAMAFTSDGAAVITAGEGHLELYASRDGTHLGFLGDHGSVWDFDLSADGRLLVSVGLDHFVRVFDVAERRLLAVLAGHGRPIHQVAVARDTAVTLDRDGTLIEWDLKPWSLPK